MKKIGLVLFLLTLAAGVLISNLFSLGRVSGEAFDISLKFGSTKGSGNIVREARNVSGFRGVDVGGVFQVEITAQKEFSVEVEADDNLLPMITTEVRGGILHIHTNKKISTGNPLRVRISAPDLEQLEVSGAANVSMKDLNNANLVVDSSGASKVQIVGVTKRLEMDVSGATRVEASELKAVDARIEASGASNVQVNVSGELKADASGASKIAYTGSPSNVQNKTSGASSVHPK